MTLERFVVYKMYAAYIIGVIAYSTCPSKYMFFHVLEFMYIIQRTVADNIFVIGREMWVKPIHKTEISSFC